MPREAVPGGSGEAFACECCDKYRTVLVAFSGIDYE
jgi:hypothetical protein